MSGHRVSRARLHAADGAPIPTKHTSSLDSARDAAMVIISVGVHALMPAAACSTLASIHSRKRSRSAAISSQAV